MKKTISLIFTFLLIMQGSSMSLLAQEITEKDVEKSKLEKEYAENQKAIAEAKKAELDAKFPKPDVSGLVGGTKVNEGTFIESQILGYCAMKSAAKEIGTRINGLGNKTNLVVYSEADVKMLARYKLMMNRLANLQRGYEAQYPLLLTAIQSVDSTFTVPDILTIQNELENEGKKNVAAGLIIDTALKFLSLLKTDIEITPTEIPIGERELVAEVFSNLSGYTLYYPQTIPLSIQDCTAGTLEACSPLLSQIMMTSEAHDKVAFLKLRSKKILEDIDANEKAQKNIDRLDAEISALNDVINNPATPKKEKKEKTTIRDKKQKEKEGLERGIQQREANYTDPNNLPAFKAAYGPIAGKIGVLDNIFKVTMEELGFKEEPKKETTGTTPTPAPTPASTPCTGKDCPQSSSQTTNVNVNVGDKQDKKEEGGGGGGGDKTFASYLQAESLSLIISQNYSRWLEVKIVKAGGNMRVKSNIFTNLIVGSRVNFSGGAIVYFNVFDKDGKSEKSGVVSAYNGYQKSSNIIGTCDEGQTTKERKRRRNVQP